MKQLKISHSLWTLVITSFALMVTSCSTKTDDPNSTVQGTFTSLYANVFSKSTTCKNCHQPGGSSGVTLDFTSSSAAYYDLLTRNLEIPSNPSQCATVRRVVAGQPANSYLMGVLFSDYNINNFAGVSGCRPNTAHLGYVNLTATEKQALVTWIQNGATQ